MQCGLAGAATAADAEARKPACSVVLAPVGDGRLGARAAQHRHAAEQEDGQEVIAAALGLAEVGNIC